MQRRLLKFALKVERYRRIRIPRRIKKVKKASRHPYAVPVITFSVLILLVGIGLIYLSTRPHKSVLHPYVVIISHDHAQQTVPSVEPTVGALLHKLKITLNAGDVVEPGLSAHINQDKFRINIYRALPVEIVDSGQTTFTFSAATTPRAIAEQAGVNLYPEDQLTATPTDSFIAQQAIGQIVNIKRSVPISLILYGTPIVTRTHSDTVGQMLGEKHIILHKGDTVQPSIDSPITPNQQIFVLRAGTTIVTATQPIAEPVQTIDDPTLTVGTSAVRQQGAPGTLLITYQLDTKTGAKTQLQSVQLQPPVTEIIAKGTAPVPQSSSLADWLLALRTCESGGNYQDNTGNGYYGAYQFSLGTWQRLGYSGLPSSAPPSLQDQAIVANTNRSGGGIASQNPGCYYKTGISAFPPG
jgi:uncharacterized protein YabE (DUF348 family)